jgi:phospholipase C
MSPEIPQPKSNAVTPVMPQITTIVMLMLENRSLDNVLGFLYDQGENPEVVYPPGSSPSFDGAYNAQTNYYHDTPYSVTNGSVAAGGAPAMVMPADDPNEAFEYVTNQLYADSEGNLPSGDFWSTTPTMLGFAWDYHDYLNVSNQSVMGCYNPSQLPGINGLAKNFAVCDRWFSSAPTQTLPNRAYAACGTSLGKLTNGEIDGTTYANSLTIFNVLGEANKTWGLYYQSTNGITSGAPNGDVLTQWMCPQINSAPGGQISPYDDASNSSAFLQALAAGTLPNFCFLEPDWGGGPNYIIDVQGNDFHPCSNVGPADLDLATLYGQLTASPQWPNMLFIITFDEHGGTYDHVPPTVTVSPDGISGDSNFQFNRLGVRVPTIFVSPFVTPGTVFRATDYQTPSAQPDFDHSSFLSTLCKWAGVDPASAGLGNRVAIAPTFEGVLNATSASAKPAEIKVPAEYKSLGGHHEIFDEPAPLDANGNPIPPRKISFQELHAASEETKHNPEAYKAKMRHLRYGV